MRISYWCSYLCSSDRVHALLDGRKVGGREGGLPGEVVVEPVFDGRADGDLGAGIAFLHRLGQDVGAVVAHQLKRVCVAGRDDLYRRVALDRPGERSEVHTSELQSLMRISSAVFCLKKNIFNHTIKATNITH